MEQCVFRLIHNVMFLAVKADPKCLDNQSTEVSHSNSWCR